VHREESGIERHLPAISTQQSAPKGSRELRNRTLPVIALMTLISKRSYELQAAAERLFVRKEHSAPKRVALPNRFCGDDQPLSWRKADSSWLKPFGMTMLWAAPLCFLRSNKKK
jgi:hypothetical protein